MALTHQQLADLAVWVDLYAARTDELAVQTAAQVAAAYAGVNFYSAAAAQAAAAQAADTSNVASYYAAGLAAQYLALTASEVVGSTVPVPTLPLPALRNGVDMEQVFDRPMKFFRRKVSEGAEPAQAFEQAMRLAQTLADGNIRLAEREASRAAVTYLAPRLGVTGYRRIVRPELSETGSCGLCIAASDQVYKTDELLPLHNRCKCTVLPIFGTEDPGNSLNNLTLGDLYTGAAGRPSAQANNRLSGTAGEDLKATRYEINEHGEWGPVITWAGDQFTGPDDLLPAAA